MRGRLPAETGIGDVSLTVADLGRSERFYTGVLGFGVAARAAGRLTLAAGGSMGAIELVERRGAPRRPPGTTGLFHVAILLPNRAALARSLRHLLDAGWPLTGAADHLVSEALYLDDPDGLGIELYRDRPRGEWPYRNERIVMATDPLDLDGLLAEAPVGAWTGLPASTTIGHVHLHVSRLAEAETFYVDTLGLDLMLRFGTGALFASAGGYHHHVGLNVWAGVGAPPPPPEAVGLRHFTLQLPDTASLQAATERLRAAGHNVHEDGPHVFAQDPSANRLRLSIAESV